MATILWNLKIATPSRRFLSPQSTLFVRQLCMAATTTPATPATPVTPVLPRVPELPLIPIRVVDLTRVLAGPYCTQILGDLGAEVLKIEHPVGGDDTRAWGPPYAAPRDSSEGPGESAYFLAVNRNKKSVAINFKDPIGASMIKKLVAMSDVFVENFKPGTLAKYGLDYESLIKVKPNLIYASISGYGQTGPYRDRAGYDVMVEAEMGLMHITGEKDGPPVKVGVAVTDLTTGLYTSNAILAALYARRHGTGGQYIDAALSDCQIATLTNIGSSVLISGERDSGRHGTAHPSIVPYEAFPTADGRMILGAGNDKLYGILCTKLGWTKWISDKRFLTNQMRVKNREILVALISTVTKTKTTKEWLEVLNGSGLPYAPVNDVQDTLYNEHVLARNMVQEIEHPRCGPIKLINSPVKYSKTQPSIRAPPPTLGEHTYQVLTTLLRYSKLNIEDMKSKGIVA